MNLEEQKKKVKKRIEEINERILSIETELITLRAEPLESLTIESIHQAQKRCQEQETALKYVQVSLRELYEDYTYLLELEVEKSRGEDDKRVARKYLGEEARETDPFGLDR